MKEKENLQVPIQEEQQPQSPGLMPATEHDRKVSTNILRSMKFYRFGLIFNHMAITVGILAFICIMSLILIPIMGAVVVLAVIAFAIIAIIVLAIISFGLLFLQENGPIQKIWEVFMNVTNGVVQTKEIAKLLTSFVPYLGMAGIVTSVLSITMLVLSKRKCVSQIIVNSIMVVMSIVILLIVLIGGVTWQG